MTHTALLTLHGMGEIRPGYEAALVQCLKPRLGGSAIDLGVHPVYYQDLLQDNERTVWDRSDRQAPMHYGDLRKVLLFGLADAAGLETGKDEPGSVYELAQLRIAQALFGACKAHGPDQPVVLISQSLGCQVMSNYLYDAQKKLWNGQDVAAGIWRNIDAFAPQIAGRPLTNAERLFLGGRTCRRWITTGCSIPIFVAAHKTMTIRPIQPPPGNSADFKWLNLYDPDDVLGWPLAPLSDTYAQLVQDRPISAGHGLVNWLLKSTTSLSHTAYWTDDDVIEPLAQMLSEFLNAGLPLHALQ